jgi:hypothetical protein
MEFELNGINYKIGKLDALSQFHIVRRLAPILSELAPNINGKQTNELGALTAIAGAISKLTDADANYVIFGLLKVVSRQQPQGLGYAQVAVGESLMFEDIDMGNMMKLVWQVLTHNLSGFFAGLPSTSTGENLKPSNE